MAVRSPQVIHMNGDFSPREGFENALRNWWLVVLLVIWGGVAGWLIHRAQPAVYQADASFQITIDFKKISGLSQFDEDHAYNQVGAIIGSTAVMNAVAAQAAAQGIQLTPQEFQYSTSLSRKEYTWVLQVQRTSPREAQVLANLWADAANKTLQDAYQHAVTADQQGLYLASLESCLAASGRTSPSSNQCGMSPTELQNQILAASSRYAQEQAAGLGLFPDLNVVLTSRAQLPTAPAEFDTNVMVLAGALIGFVISLWAVQVNLATQLARRLGHA